MLLLVTLLSLQFRIRLYGQKKLVDHIRSLLKSDLAALKAAAQETYQAATGEESRPENQYDTRALEASYLAGAQAKRVIDLEASLAAYKQLEIRDFDENTPIGPTALVQLEINEKKLLVFVIPTSGGLTVEFESKTIHVITPKSPLGEVLIGRNCGDTVVVEKGSKALEYKILSLR